MGITKHLIKQMHRISLPTYRHFSSNNNDFQVTLENIFSEENKDRVVSNMKHVKPGKFRYMENNPKKAAVLVPMCYVNNIPSLLFMVRSEGTPTHSGDVCFPGGLQANTKEDLIQTAIRETFEEIGLSRETIHPWVELQSIPNTNGTMQITPILAYCGHIKLESLVLCEKEVEEVFHCPIENLCDPSQIRYTNFLRYTSPVFLGAKHKIWGLTAIILHFTLSSVAPGLYKFKLRHNTS